jgi:hypothetical protein
VVEGSHVTLRWVFQLVSDGLEFVLDAGDFVVEDGGVDGVEVLIGAGVLRSKVCILWMSSSF